MLRRRDFLRFLKALLFMIAAQLWHYKRRVPVYKFCSFFAIQLSFLCGLPSWIGSRRLAIFISQLLLFLFLFKSRYILLLVDNKQNMCSLSNTVKYTLKIFYNLVIATITIRSIYVKFSIFDGFDLKIPRILLNQFHMV